jgi:HPt (histidine-containing phosphotransfer) domain-containing protein
MALQENGKAGARGLSLEQILADLKREYLAGIPSRVATIREHLSLGDAAVLEEDFHKIKGTGMTYGVPELSKIGELGETICRDRQQQITLAVPVLLDLISSIHESRSRQQTFDLTADPRFSDLDDLK